MENNKRRGQITSHSMRGKDWEIFVNMLWDFLERCLNRKKCLKDKGINSTISPIYKEKKDIEECENYERDKVDVTYYEVVGED